MARRSMRLLITAPRGSGGAQTHLRRVLPVLLRERPDWHIELFAPTILLRQAFARDDLAWMRPVTSGAYAGRLRWEMVGMPAELARRSDTLLYSPFGPLLNVAAAPYAVWASRNIIPLLPPETWEVPNRDRLRMLGLRQLLLFGTRVAAGTVCVSQFSRSRLSLLAGVSEDAIRVVPHGVDPADPDAHCLDVRAEAVRRTPYVLNVGEPVAYRRTRELIQGFARLSERRSDLPRLVLLGGDVDRDYAEGCFQLLEPLVRAGRAVRLGHLAHSDVLALTAAAHVVAYPSVHEDCPNVVLEALAAGRVIVCADIPATRELADGVALFVNEPGPVQLEQALDRAIYDEPLRHDLARGAAARALGFTWERTIAGTLRVLDDALQTVMSRPQPAWSRRARI